MSGETRDRMWILMNVGAVLLPGAGLAYGMRAGSPAVDRLRDRKTKELYSRRDPDQAAPLPGQRR